MRRKYVVGLFITLALFILLYPVDKKLDLSGEWTIKHLLVNDEELLNKTDVENYFHPGIILNRFSIYNRNFQLQTIRLSDSTNRGTITGNINVLNNDKLVISSSSEGFLDSEYSIRIDTVLDKTLSPAERDVNVILTADNITIHIDKHEVVGERNRMLRRMNNNRGIQRGRP